MRAAEKSITWFLFQLTAPQGGWLFSLPIPSQSVRYNTTNNFDTKQTISVTFLKTKKRLNKSIAFLHKQIYNNVFQLTDFHLTINKGCRNIFPHPLLTIVFYSNSFSGLIFHINLMLSGVEIVSFWYVFTSRQCGF